MNNIYVSKDGQQCGPFSLEQIRQQVQSGYFSPADSAWRDGMPDWVPIKAIIPQDWVPQKTATPKQPAASASFKGGPIVKNRSDWSVVLGFFGALGLVTIIVGILIILSAPYERVTVLEGIITIVSGVVSALNCFLAAFIVNVFTDMRDYLKYIAEK